jgi:hypothetical protein
MIHGTFVEAFGQLRNQINFLSKAISDEDQRVYNFRYIIIEPSTKEEGKFRAITSDGRRIHIVEPLACTDDNGIEPGLWRFLRITPKTAWITKMIPQKHDLATPNFDKVIPTAKPEFETTFNSDYIYNKLSGKVLCHAVELVNGFPEPTAIKPDYLLDLGSEFWKVLWYGNNKSVVFESANYKAVIMPMNF